GIAYQRVAPPEVKSSGPQWAIWCLFGFLSIYHQGTVFADFRHMSSATRAVASDYAPWIDMRLEIAFRWLIVLGLYLGVGEFFVIRGWESFQFVAGVLTVFGACIA